MRRRTFFANVATLLIAFTVGFGTALAQESAPPLLSFPVACEIGATCFVQNYVDHDSGPGAKDYRCGDHSGAST